MEVVGNEINQVSTKQSI